MLKAKIKIFKNLSFFIDFLIANMLSYIYGEKIMNKIENEMIIDEEFDLICEYFKIRNN